MKILLVDDEPQVLDVAARALRQLAGWEVITCGDAVEAMARARSDRPDGILLDLMMPTMTGARFLTQLQRDAATRDIPVILLTGADRVAAGAVDGVRGIIHKPFDIATLAEDIRRMLGPA